MSNHQKRDGGIVICCVDGDIEKLIDAIDKVGYHYVKTKERTTYRISIYSKELNEFVERYSHTAYNKTIDAETIHANNYKYSDIRNWLNDDFYDCAFALGDTNIQTTTLEDGIQDKAFLLRTSDYSDSSYGFASATDRNCKTTDWARARGAYCASAQYDGCYWTRTSIYDNMSKYVGYEVEQFLYDEVTRRYIATRPALTIQIA
jgi:hypothetical protein